MAAREQGELIERLEPSRALVKEDCEGLEAVSAGSDSVAKVLHARYGRRRLDTLEVESNRLAAEGRPGGAERARENRDLREVVAELEAETADPKVAERTAALKDASSESRRGAREAKRRLGAVDGSDVAARERQSAAVQRAF